MLIYIAGPLFSEAEQRFNLELTEKLEALGFHVFLPQRDGVKRDKPPYDAMTPEERRQAMFDLDKSRIITSDVFLLVLDGRVPDEGACVELGIAYCHKWLGDREKFLIGLHTDSRAAFVGARLNPIVLVPLDHVADDEETLLRVLSEHWPSVGR
ncbi:MAG: nucleoside 2-deoxyribosyltransferase domain-containing protein [Rubrobacter sp.]|nr:nucleoside 2-deoxyribosyltransferase domain-containing protein [Rubrobacter sp.]